jgi:hypothetical protein
MSAELLTIAWKATSFFSQRFTVLRPSHQQGQRQAASCRREGRLQPVGAVSGLRSLIDSTSSDTQSSPFPPKQTTRMGYRTIRSTRTTTALTQPRRPNSPLRCGDRNGRAAGDAQYATARGPLRDPWVVRRDSRATLAHPSDCSVSHGEMVIDTFSCAHCTARPPTSEVGAGCCPPVMVGLYSLSLAPVARDRRLLVMSRGRATGRNRETLTRARAANAPSSANLVAPMRGAARMDSGGSGHIVEDDLAEVPLRMSDLAAAPFSVRSDSPRAATRPHGCSGWRRRSGRTRDCA